MTLIGRAANNIGSAFAGLQAGALATDRDYDDVIDKAIKSGFKPEELVSRLQKKAQDDTRFMQGVAMENTTFGRGIQADKMRQETYNTMAQNEQQNRFNAAQGLMNAYNDARRTNADLMANTLRF